MPVGNQRIAQTHPARSKTHARERTRRLRADVGRERKAQQDSDETGGSHSTKRYVESHASHSINRILPEADRPPVSTV